MEKFIPKIESEVQKEDKIQERIKREFVAVFEKYINPEERLAEIIKKIEPFFQNIDKDIFSEEEMKFFLNNLKSCVNAESKDQFFEELTKTFEPIFDIYEKYPAKFEEAQAKAMNQFGGFIEINRLLSYVKKGSVVHIHAPAGKTVENKAVLYRNGMKKLAEIVRDDKDVKMIIATSHLVAEHASLFERIGFKTEKVSEEFKREHFSEEEREIKRATISREDFLKRFLQKAL